MKTVLIGEISKQIRGVSYAKQDALDNPRDGYSPILRANNITDEGLNFDDLVYVPDAKIVGKQRLRKHDVVVAASSGSLSVVGKTAQTESDFAGAFGAFCKVLRPAPNVDPRYFGHFFRTPQYRRKISSLAAGANINNLKNEHLDGLEIPLPPLPEQKRIAAILDAVDALRAKRRESIAQLDTLLQATFLDMFGDPVTNPKEFPVRALAEFYASETDGTKCGPFGSALKKEELADSGVAVWNMDNIDPAGRMILPFRMWVSEDKYKELEAYSVSDGDVIVSRAGTVGKMCVANTGGVKSILSTNLIRIRLGPMLSPIYFVSLMTYCKGRVGRLKTGPDGAFTHMNTKVLDGLKFPCPSFGLQRQYSKLVETIDRQKENHYSYLDELDTLFASLQSRAFSGQL